MLEAFGALKVVHDCPHDSHVLFHQHGVRVGKVFDLHAVFEKRRAVHRISCWLPPLKRTVLLKHECTSDGGRATTSARREGGDGRPRGLATRTSVPPTHLSRI